MYKWMTRIKKYKETSDEFGTLFSIKSSYYRMTKKYNSYIQLCTSLLLSEYREAIDVIQNDKTQAESIRPIVWSFWWQGEDSLPDILQTCLASHKQYIQSQGIEYIFIDQNNIAEYLEIPSVIYNKLDSGIISFTHFSDYVRIALLEKYGGAWIDITLLLIDKLPKDIFDYEFYSLKTASEAHKPNVIGQMVTQCNWTGFMLCAHRAHSPLFNYLKEALESYWERHDKAVDYFLLNLLIKCAYDHNSYIKQIIDNIPYNNPHLYDLAPCINEPYKEEVMRKLSENTVFCKVTQKKPSQEFTQNTVTFYGYLKKLFR